MAIAIGLLAPLATGAAIASAPIAGAAIAGAAVVGDSMPASLTGRTGDAARGRAIVTTREDGLCLLCHSGPFPDAHLQGTIGPNLSGVGARLSEGQIRLRIARSSTLDAGSLMPDYAATEGLTNVAAAFQGRPVLTADQIEDVVAYLTTLRTP